MSLRAEDPFSSFRREGRRKMPSDNSLKNWSLALAFQVPLLSLSLSRSTWKRRKKSIYINSRPTRWRTWWVNKESEKTKNERRSKGGETSWLNMYQKQFVIPLVRLPRLLRRQRLGLLYLQLFSLCASQVRPALTHTHTLTAAEHTHRHAFDRDKIPVQKEDPVQKKKVEKKKRIMK